MTKRDIKWFMFVLVLVVFYSLTSSASCYAVETDSAKIDRLLAQLQSDFKFNFDRTQDTLKELKALEPSFSKKQKDSAYLVHAAMLGFQGKHRERAELVQSYINQVTDTTLRARFLGQLVNSFVNLGDYENAIIYMNESNDLLPKLSKDVAVRSVLQSTIGVLSMFKAYDEALVYANRMLQMKESPENPGIKCMAILNIVELNYLQGNVQRARSSIPESDIACKNKDLELYRQILRAFSVIDLINTGNFKEGIKVGQPLADEFTKFNNGTEYRVKLEEALCRAFIGLGDYKSAQKYGTLAFDHVKSSKSPDGYEAVISTLAKLKELQGDTAGALEFLKIAFEYRGKRTNEDLQKNVAYQRVKFDMKDKAAQLILLEKKNEMLAVERELERRSTQHLFVVVILAVVASVVLFIVLLVILKQKRSLAHASKIDQLTQVYGYSYFLSKASEIFGNRKSEISVILVNLDRFRKVNEVFGFGIGDALLVAVGAVLKQTTHEGSIVGRIGADEFGICLERTTEGLANDVAENCRKAISSINLEQGAQSVKLTASIGVAVIDTKGLTSFSDTINAARDALLLAKNSGGDCVRCFESAGQERSVNL